MDPGKTSFYAHLDPFSIIAAIAGWFSPALAEVARTIADICGEVVRHSGQIRILPLVFVEDAVIIAVYILPCDERRAVFLRISRDGTWSTTVGPAPHRASRRMEELGEKADYLARMLAVTV